MAAKQGLQVQQKRELETKEENYGPRSSICPERRHIRERR